VLIVVVLSLDEKQVNLITLKTNKLRKKGGGEKNTKAPIYGAIKNNL